MNTAPRAKPMVAVTQFDCSSALGTNSRNERQIITPAVSPIKKPYERREGLNKAANKPPIPVPKLAKMLSKRMFSKGLISLIKVILQSLLCQFLLVLLNKLNFTQ